MFILASLCIYNILWVQLKARSRLDTIYTKPWVFFSWSKVYVIEWKHWLWWGLNRTCFPGPLRRHFIAFLKSLVVLFCPSFIWVFSVLPFLFLLLCVDSRWNRRHTGDPEAPAHLREQQRGPQYRQHTKHALLQQQHGLAQRLTPQDPKLRRATAKKSWFVHHLLKFLFWDS